MTARDAPELVDRFRSLIGARLGLHFDESRVGLLERVLGHRAEHHGTGGASYVELVERGSQAAAELRVLAQQLTVTETFFFRQLEHFRVLEELVFARARSAPGLRTVRLLSAGCASGEEPYSLAILAREHLDGARVEVEVRGVDVNREVLQRAQRARYSRWALRETPQHILARWFSSQGPEHALSSDIRSAVVFEERNLAEPQPDLWEHGHYDAVFCRNLLMYLTPRAAAALVERIAEALVPGGYLFLGYAENLRGISQAFDLRQAHGTFYYQRRAAGEHRRPPPASPRPHGESGYLLALEDESWVQAIGRSSERIRSLTRAELGAPQAGAEPPEASALAAELQAAIELLRRERFAEALALLQGLPPSSGADPDVLLLRSVLLTQGGQLDAAERTCDQLLGIDAFTPGAHYLLALCSEARGARERAREHQRTAVHLDPSFAMARLHLGLLLRRLGEREAARRELEQALVLLPREDTSRLLLFAGGFHRSALIALCRAELLACGAPR